MHDLQEHDIINMKQTQFNKDEFETFDVQDRSKVMINVSLRCG